MLSHLLTTLAAGRRITVLADRDSTAVSPTKHANWQPEDLIQLLAGLSGCICEQSFYSGKGKREYFRMGERKNYYGLFRSRRHKPLSVQYLCIDGGGLRNTGDREWLC